MNLLQRFWPTKGLPDEFLAVDIGSDFVKVAACHQTAEGVAIKSVAKQSLPWDALRGGAVVSEAAVVEALSLAVKEVGSTANTAIVGLTGEMVANFTTAARLRRPQSETLVTATEFAETKQKLSDVAEMEAEKLLAPLLPNVPLDLAIISSATATIKVDNFLVATPVGFKGEQVEINLFTAFAPQGYLDTLKKILKLAKLNLGAFTSELFAITCLLQRAATAPLNVVIIDVGGATTKVAVVFGGSLVGSRTLGLGGRFFSEAVAHELGVTFDEGELKKMGHSLKRDADENVGTALNKYLPLWLSGVAQALGDIDGIKVLPSKILVTGGGANLAEIVLALKTNPWEKNLPFGGAIDVMPLNLSSLEIKAEVPLTLDFGPAVAVGLMGPQIYENRN